MKGELKDVYLVLDGNDIMGCCSEVLQAHALMKELKASNVSQTTGFYPEDGGRVFVSVAVPSGRHIADVDLAPFELYQAEGCVSWFRTLRAGTVEIVSDDSTVTEISGPFLSEAVLESCKIYGISLDHKFYFKMSSGKDVIPKEAQVLLRGTLYGFLEKADTKKVTFELKVSSEIYRILGDRTLLDKSVQMGAEVCVYLVPLT